MKEGQHLKEKVAYCDIVCTKNDTIAPLDVATQTVQRELPKYELALPYLCTKNETMAPLHVTTLTVNINMRCPIGRVETLDAKYNLIALFELLVWPHEVEPWFHSWVQR